MQALVLAAGKGTRMRSEIPKVLHTVFDRPLLDYVLETLKGLQVRQPVVVIGNGSEQVKQFLGKRARVVYQREQKGTGHAVMMAAKVLKASRDDVLIWPGDMPLLKRETVRRFIREHRKSKAAVSVLSSLQVDPTGYGRILRAGGRFFAIREELDASESEKRIQEVNTGVYLFRIPLLIKALRQVRPDNKKGELYLTDTIEILQAADEKLEAYPLAGPEEGLGINSRKDLAVAIAKMNQRAIQEHQSRGVTFMAPEQTFVAPGVRIGTDTMIYPWTYIEAGVKIGQGCRIGPFAKIRKGTVIGDGSVVGSFVEVNRTRIGKQVSAKHLSYLGDTVIGDGTNVGAGVITANYDGKNKHVTRVGKKVRIGSNTVFVAPVSVGDEACTGAGSVVKAGTKIKRKETVVGVPARPVAKKKRKS